MPSKSILKKTTISTVKDAVANDAVANDAVANDAVAEDIVDETNIVLDDEFLSTEQDIGIVSGTKKLQIKKKNLLVLLLVLENLHYK